MNTTADIPFTITTADPVAQRAARQMRVMEWLIHMGLGLAEALKAQVCDEGPVVMHGDVGLLFARISRAVRQSIVLEMKIAEALRAWRGLTEAQRAEQRATVAMKPAEPQACDAPEIEDLDEVGRGAEGWRGETERGEREERFWADSYVIEDEGSFVSIVAKICRDLGVTPDWSAWSGDGSGDLVVRADDSAAGFWRGEDLAMVSGSWPAGRVPPKTPSGRGVSGQPQLLC
jgi:hypothetical protein